MKTEKNAGPILFRKTPAGNSTMIRLRLVSLFVMLGLVIIAMNVARKPATWERLGFVDTEPDAGESSRADQSNGSPAKVNAPGGMNNSVIVHPEQPGDATENSNDSVIGIVNDDELIGFDIDKIEADLHSVRIDFWGKCFESLTRSDRIALFEILRFGRLQRVPDEKQKQRFQRVWKRVAAYRDRFNSLVLTKTGTLEGGGDDKKQLWYELLHRMREIWNHQVEPAVDSLIRGQSTAEHVSIFVDLQELLDPIAIAKIKDGTPTVNPDESPIWIRWVEMLSVAPPEEIRSQANKVAHVELATQPEKFRGKLVQFAGRVRRAQAILAAESDLGIEKYYSLWIQDAQGSIPYSVYALNLPAGFPEVDWSSQDMDVPVSVDARFVKNRAYDSNGITRQCPFLIAHTLRLGPEIKNSSWTWNPNSSTIILGVLLLVAFSGVFAFRVYRATQSFRIRDRGSSQRIQNTLSALENDPEVMTPSQRLKTFDPGPDAD